MANTETISVGEHRVVLAPDGTTTVDGVSISPTDWKEMVRRVSGHLIRVGVAPDTSHRQPRTLLRMAPWWVRLVTFGQVLYLPGVTIPDLPKHLRKALQNRG